MYYVVERARHRSVAATAINDLGRLAGTSRPSRQMLRLPARSWPTGSSEHYEDGVQVAAGLQVGLDYLVTRNAKDFKGAPLMPRSPGGGILGLVESRQTPQGLITGTPEG